jgi:hypothetical protein
MAFTYRAKYLDEERMELVLDGVVDDPGVLRLRVHDPEGTVICERIVKQWPYTVTFKAVPSGRYDLELAEIGGDPPARRFTWKDWENDFGGGGSKEIKLPAGIQAVAFLDVS